MRAEVGGNPAQSLLVCQEYEVRADGQGGPSQVEGSAPMWRWEELSSHADKTQLSGIKEGSRIQETVYRKSSI